MKNFIKKTSILSVIIIFLALPCLVFAQSPTETLEDVGGKANFARADETTVSRIIGSVVNTALSLLGIVFVILMIYGGGRWMLAQGNEQEVDAAKKIIKNSLIGLIIVVGAYAIYNLVSYLITGESPI